MTSVDDGDSKSGVLDYECGENIVAPTVTATCNTDYRLAGDSEDENRDIKMTEWLKVHIADPKISVLMGVYDRVDATGHRHSFDDNEYYLEAIHQADALVGQLLSAVKERASTANEDWLVILISDHGGHYSILFGTHDVWPQHDSAIPFVMAAYGQTIIPLANLRAPVTHMDVHPTIMRWFGRSSSQADGHVQGLQ